MQELATIPARESALTVYTTDKGLDPYLSHIRAEIDAFVPDVTTKKGRDAIASIAYKVAQSKTALDKLGKELVDELKEKPKLIDAERKRMRDLLDAWKDEVRKPLTDFELAEQERIASHENEIQLIVNWRTAVFESSEQIEGVIESLSALDTGERFEEFELRATKELAATLDSLRSFHADFVKREQEQAELARLRAEAAEREQREREERIAREAAERAQREAEAKAKADREAVIRRELELKLAAERAEREKLEAIAQAEREREQAQARAEAAAKAERDRIAAEQAAEKEEQERREANKKHCSAINNQAAIDLQIEGITERQAKAIVVAIAKGRISNVKIHY